MEKNNTLKKDLGLIEAITLVIGMVIGSGIFFKPSVVFKNAGSPGLGILAWIVGGIITIASGLTVAEIASAIPKTGGLFAYLKDLYGEKWAFLFGWVETIVYIPGTTAALAIIFTTQATYFIGLSDLQQKIFAIAIIMFIMVINMYSTKFGGRLQLVSTFGKLIPIALIILCGLTLGHAHAFTPLIAKSSAGAGAGFGAAILGTLWAYDGWMSVGNIAGELKNPEKDLPRSIILGLTVVIVVYILFNLAVINVMPLKAVIGSSKAASDVSVILFGNNGAALISVGILISIIGALNGYFMTGARIPYAMAVDGLLPFHKQIGKLNEKHRTPLNAMVLEFVLASLYVCTGSFNTLTDLAIFVIWIFFTMAVFGVFILRKKKIASSYKVPLYPFVPLVGILGGIYILFNTLFTDTKNAFYGLAITLIGFPVYYYLTKKRNIK